MDTRELPGPVRVVRQREERHWLYTAWEPVQDRRYSATMDAPDSGTWGRVDTRRHPDPDSLPGDHVQGLIYWELEQRRNAYRAIESAFPEATEGFRSQGTVIALGDPESVLERMSRKQKGKIAKDADVATAPTFAGMK